MKKRAIVTGGAGFIGSTLVENLLKRNWKVSVIDNFDPFYAKSIKKKNIAPFSDNPDFELLEADIRDLESLQKLLNKDYNVMIHLAAKAGVRPSIKNPGLYQDVNVMGTQNLLEICKLLDIKKFIFASSSSVYGVNPDVPWSEDDYVLKPISPYASSKISGELMGHVYSELYNIQFLALRLFTVYGPKQRPDLAIHKFAKMILRNEAIPVYGDGSTQRDYTYVEDIVSGFLSAIEYESSKYEIINLGNSRTVSLSEMITTIENVFGRKALIDRLPMQAGDVPKTYADISKAKKLLDYQPSTTFEEGIQKFRQWYISMNQNLGQSS